MNELLLLLLLLLLNCLLLCVISGFRREVDENCALLGYYAANSGNLLPTFRDNLSLPSSGVRNPWSLKRFVSSP